MQTPRIIEIPGFGRFVCNLAAKKKTMQKHQIHHPAMPEIFPYTRDSPANLMHLEYFDQIKKQHFRNSTLLSVCINNLDVPARILANQIFIELVIPLRRERASSSFPKKRTFLKKIASLKPQPLGGLQERSTKNG